MNNRGVRIIILCEDQRHETFLRRVLKACGFNTHKFRVERPKRGKGSAEQRVRETYPNEVRALRRRPSGERVGIVVMIDADRYSVSERLQAFDQTLCDAGLDKRSDDESIAILVPKRNIETWQVHLAGGSVNEEDDYKRMTSPQDIRNVVPAFVDRIANGPRNDDPDSLRDALSELQQRLAR